MGVNFNTIDFFDFSSKHGVGNRTERSVSVSRRKCTKCNQYRVSFSRDITAAVRERKFTKMQVGVNSFTGEVFIVFHAENVATALDLYFDKNDNGSITRIRINNAKLVEFFASRASITGDFYQQWWLSENLSNSDKYLTYKLLEPIKQ